MKTKQSDSKKEILYSNSLFSLLRPEDCLFLERLIDQFSPSVQEIRQLVIVARDFCMWEEPFLEEVWISQKEKANNLNIKNLKGRDLRKKAVALLVDHWNQLKREPRVYSAKEKKSFIAKNLPESLSTVPISEKQNHRHCSETIWGRCPVASEGTRCCNLYTLDAVVSCGFDCTYCTIQSFYNGTPAFKENLRDKLDEIVLEPGKDYHIGTGQGSDSLLWGNKNGLLDDLAWFARKHPGVVLEMKTKSDNIEWFINTDIPPNFLVTWSLNPQSIVTQEERGTASLDQRLSAARKLADKGIPVGFHFHPMVYYKDCEREYLDVFKRLQEMFRPEEVVQVSLGTLTFIKPVLKKIRGRNDLYSRILQMPLEEINRKYSYPFEVKQKLFSSAYNAFSKEWKESVFFYLCMEDLRLWEPVFGRTYSSNEEFETDMIDSYKKKMGLE